MVELGYQAPALEPATRLTGTQVNIPQACDTSHPQMCVPVDATADTASHQTVSLKRFLYPPRFQVIIEDSVIRAYPQGIIEFVIDKGTDIVGDGSQLFRHVNMRQHSVL